MNAINTVRTHAQTHAHSYAYVQNGKGVFDHTKEIEDEEKRAAVLALMAEYSVLCAVATGKADLVAAAVAKGCTVNETDQVDRCACMCMFVLFVAVFMYTYIERERVFFSLFQFFFPLFPPHSNTRTFVRRRGTRASTSPPPKEAMRSCASSYTQAPKFPPKIR